MSIWLLLFFHYTQPLRPVAYFPWPGPDYFWSIMMLNWWHVSVIYPDTVPQPVIYWYYLPLHYPTLCPCFYDFCHCCCFLWTWLRSSLLLGFMLVPWFMHICVLYMDYMKHHSLSGRCSRMWLVSVFCFWQFGLLGIVRLSLVCAWYSLCSTQLFCQESSSVVMTVACYDDSRHPWTPIFPLDSYSRCAEKN